MKTQLLIGALFCLVLSGCAPAEEGATSDMPSVAEASMIELEGDFAGPLGIQLWSLKDEMEADVPGTLALVRNMGFEVVELHSTYGMTPEAFRAELDKVGLDATGMHASYERFEEDHEAIFDEAIILGAELVGIPWIPHDETSPFSVEQAREASADFNRWGAAAAERGLMFYYHPHGYEFQPSEEGTLPMDVFLEETNPEHVAFEMDVFWTFLPGVDPAELLRKHPDRWKLMHLKDMREGYPYPDHSGRAPAEAKVVIGAGQIDYAAVLEAAKEIGLMHYYIEDETVDPVGNIPPSIDFLESVTF